MQPNLILSPILARFASSLESIRAASPVVEPAQMIQALKETYQETVKELYNFFEWTKSSEVRSLIDFDASKYEPQAGLHPYDWTDKVRRGWQGKALPS